MATSVSQSAAIASLDAADELLARPTPSSRTRQGHRHAAAGRLHRPAVQANFVWLPLAERTKTS